MERSSEDYGEAEVITLALEKKTDLVLLDKLGLKRSLLLSVACTMTGLVGMVLSRNIYMYGLVLVGLLLGAPFGTVGNPILVTYLFGNREYGSKFGLVTAASNLGTSLSPFLGGSIYDATGSYQLAFIVMLGLCAVVLVGYFFLLSKEKAK